MEARIYRVVVVSTLIVSLHAAIASGASYRTANFIVEAPTPELAEKIGKAAEHYRHDLAVTWIGAPMPNWSRPCPIQAEVSPTLGAGGKTSFVFDKINGKDEVFGWDMNIQGSEERVLDSVLPHEVTHTVFASYFRRPLPRWADEGACTTVEHTSERNKQQIMLVNFLRTDHGIAFDKLFAMKEYPHDVLPLYSEGYSLARFLIDQGGRQKFVEFVGDGMKSDNWSATVNKHYGFANLQALQDNWLDWVKQGSPALGPQNGRAALASNDRDASQNGSPNFRAQSGDDRDMNHAAGRLASTSRSSTAPLAPQTNLAASDRNWTSAENRLSANEGSDSFTGNNDGAAGLAKASVYDRRNTNSVAATPTVAANPPFVDAPPPQPLPASSANLSRQPELIAQRDTSQSGNGEHKVLLEWSRPQ